MGIGGGIEIEIAACGSGGGELAQKRRGGMGRFACGVEVIPATDLVGWKRKI
jgi:hypothetical protein